MLIVFHSAKIRTGQSGLSDPTIEERTWKGGSKLCGFLFSRCSVNGGKKRNKNGATERMAGRNEHADMCIPCELVWKKKSCLSGGGGVVQLLLPISCVFSTQKGNIKKKKEETQTSVTSLPAIRKFHRARMNPGQSPTHTAARYKRKTRWLLLLWVGRRWRGWTTQSREPNPAG